MRNLKKDGSNYSTIFYSNQNSFSQPTTWKTKAIEIQCLLKFSLAWQTFTHPPSNVYDANWT